MDIHVIGFNIRSCDDPNGNSIPERAPRLAKVLEDYDADIVCLQEFVPLWEPFMDSLTRGVYDYVHKYRNTTIDIEGSPILWKKDRFEKVRLGWFWLSDTPEEESRGWDELCHCFRMCLCLVLREKATGKEFAVLNTHYGFGDAGQVASGELIASYQKRLYDYPTVLVGDFNMTQSAPGYATITKHFVDVNMATAKDLSISFHNYGYANPPRLIDYCFVTSDVTPKSYKLIEDLVEGQYPSDHYGTSMHLQIP